MYQVLIVVYLIIAIAIISLVLLQQGKGADAGASFGGGASGTLFGASGSSNFLSRTTAILITIFFILSLILGIIVTSTTSKDKNKSIDNLNKVAMEVNASKTTAPIKTIKVNNTSTQTINSIPGLTNNTK
ncbi:MAG: preprotein translocase subunit SecG [Psittacicella sp.]